MSRIAFNDLLNSETRYLASLTLLVTSYIKPIEHKVNPRHLADISPFFAIIKSIHAFHQSINPLLNQRVDVGSVFVRSAVDFRLYSVFTSVYDKAIEAMRITYKQSRKFKACLDRPHRSSTALMFGSNPVASDDMYTFIDIVLRRPSQYSSRLHELAQHTDIDDAERASLRKAAELIDEICVVMKASRSGRSHPAVRHTMSASRSLNHRSDDPGTPTSTQRSIISSTSYQSTPLQSRHLMATVPPINSSITPPPPAHAVSRDEASKRRQSLPTTLSTSNLDTNQTVPHSLVSSVRQSPNLHAYPAEGNLSLDVTSSLFTLVSPPASPSSSPSSSFPPHNNAESVFRYVPRIVLQRFLAVDAQLRTLNPERSRPITVNSYLPSSSTPEVHTFPGASILVADVSGFTKLNETFSLMEKGAGAEQVTTHLNRYFSSLLDIIDQHGGDCVKFAGDALIVLFLPSKQWLNTDGSNFVDESIAFASSSSHHSASTDQVDDRSRLNLPLLDRSNRQREEQAETCLRAVQCALQLQKDVGVYHGSLVEKDLETPPDSTAPGDQLQIQRSHRREKSEARVAHVELALHIAIGCGTAYGFHVGGFNAEFEFILTGSAFGQLKEGLDLSQRGEVVVSKAVWDLIHVRCTGVPCQRQSKPLRSGEVRVVSVELPVKLSSLPNLDLRILASHPFIPLALRAYVPRSVLDMLDAHSDGGYSSWLSEIRTTTVIFVNLHGLVLNKNESNDAADTHKVCLAMQKIITRNQGFRRQFLVDDKGTTLIVVFGVPPFAHEDDAYRGVKCALEMREQLMNLDVAHGMGIATGVVYSGSVGSSHRQEHAVVGDIVNSAARIAAKAESSTNGCILLDHATYSVTQHSFEMREEGEIKVKGKNRTIRIYTPLRADRLAAMNASSTKSHTETMNRGPEQARFMQAILELQSKGTGALLFLEGDSGTGKTHLIRQFFRIVKAHAGTLYPMYAKGDATASGSYLSTWTPVLEELMGLAPPTKGGALVQKRTKQVMKFLKQIQPSTSHSSHSLDPRLPFLNLVLAEPVSLAENDLSRMVKNQPKQIIKQAEGIVQFILTNAFAYQRSLGKFPVLFIEDLHLIDTSSLQVLMRISHTHSVLLVCTARPPTQPVRLQTSSHTVRSPVNESSSVRQAPRWGERMSSRPSEATSPEISTISHSHSHSQSNGPDWNEEKLDDVSADESVHKLELQNEDHDTVITTSSVPVTTTSSSRAVPITTSSSLAGRDCWSDSYDAWLRIPNLVHVRLGGLGEKPCTRLVCQRLHAMSLDPALVELIMKRSRGNPFYAVEVASHLMEKGYLLLRHDGHCMINPDPNPNDSGTSKMSVEEASLALPTSLKGLVTKRLDNLPVNERFVCKMASAAAAGSQEFDRQLLIDICLEENISEAQTLTSIEALKEANILAERKEVLSESAGGTTIWLSFCHDLVHSACYDLLVMSQKLRLHSRLAAMVMQRQLANREVSQSNNPASPSQLDRQDSETQPTSASSRGPEDRVSLARHDLFDELATSDSFLAEPSVVKRRPSVFTYHLQMAIQSYKGAGEQSKEMKQFIRQAKDYLEKRVTLATNPSDVASALEAETKLAAEAQQATSSIKSAPPGDSRRTSSGMPPPLPPTAAERLVEAVPTTTAPVLGCVHVTLAQLYHALQHAGVAPDATEKVVRQLITASKTHPHSASTPFMSPNSSFSAKTPPPIPAISQTGTVVVPDLPIPDDEPDADAVMIERERDAPILSKARSQSFRRKPVNFSVRSDEPTNLASSSRAASPVEAKPVMESKQVESVKEPKIVRPTNSSLQNTADALAKMNRDDLMQLRTLVKQSRPPPIATRKVLECMSLLVNAIQHAQKGPRSSKAGALSATDARDAWKTLIAGPTFLSILGKTVPQACANLTAQSLPNTVTSLLSTYVSDATVDSLTNQRSMIPAVRLIWQWCHAICTTLQLSVADSSLTDDVMLPPFVRARTRSRSVDIVVPPDLISNTAEASSPTSAVSARSSGPNDKLRRSISARSKVRSLTVKAGGINKLGLPLSSSLVSTPIVSTPRSANDVKRPRSPRPTSPQVT